jgi:putative transposase
MGIQISPPYPKSWPTGVLKKTFSQNYKKSTRMRDHRIQYPDRSYPYGDDNTTQIQSIRSKVISRIKAQTASHLRKKFSWLSKVYWKENIVWSPGYFVSTIGLDEKSILEYVRWQKTQDLGQAKLELV